MSKDKMTRAQKIQTAVLKEFQQGQVKTKKDIVVAVQKHFPEVLLSSILPADLCINHKNNDPYSGKHPIFKYLGRNKFEILPLSATAISNSLISHPAEKKQRNPNWTRDELILALDLYFKINPRKTSEKNPEIIALSQLLNQLPTHSNSLMGQNFRNPSSVYMKLCNFLRLDKSYTNEGKVGLDAGSKLDEEVWNHFASNRPSLIEAAESIKAHFNAVGLPSKLPEAEEIEFPEGGIVERTHKLRERNPALVRKRKIVSRQALGKLYCEVCGFDFEARYGNIGQDFIECHHKNPLSDITDVRKTKIDDLALVCSNCHRMLHRIRPWIGISDLKKMLK